MEDASTSGNFVAVNVNEPLQRALRVNKQIDLDSLSAELSYHLILSSTKRAIVQDAGYTTRDACSCSFIA